MIKTEITGIGYYVPEQVITNKDLEQKMDTTNEWIVSRSGIEERHWVRNGMCTSDLAFEASKKAMEAANVSPKEIDLVIVGTISSDYFFPGVSAQLQDLLGLIMWVLLILKRPAQLLFILCLLVINLFDPACMIQFSSLAQKSSQGI